MKSKTISVLILSITLIFSTTLILASFGLSKPKPNPNTNPELITFEGDLVGSQEVVGCCPNAGPFPEYTMTLSEDDIFPEGMEGTHEGHIFMNVFMDLSLKGHGKEKSYIVQFWWEEEDEYFIEIRGGEIHQDRKTKILTVIFTNEDCNIWIGVDPQTSVKVSFTLIREPL